MLGHHEARTWKKRGRVPEIPIAPTRSGGTIPAHERIHPHPRRRHTGPSAKLGRAHRNPDRRHYRWPPCARLSATLDRDDAPPQCPAPSACRRCGTGCISCRDMRAKAKSAPTGHAAARRLSAARAAAAAHVGRRTSDAGTRPIRCVVGARSAAHLHASSPSGTRQAVRASCCLCWSEHRDLQCPHGLSADRRARYRLQGPWPGPAIPCPAAAKAAARWPAPSGQRDHRARTMCCCSATRR
jgi:hypothetical protein